MPERETLVSFGQMKGRKPTTIDEYIEECPEPARRGLRQIRSLIRRIVPEAEEKISYDMPAFALGGNLVWFAGYARHIALYPSVRAGGALGRALARYESGKGTLRFPLDEPLPLRLIEQVVRIRVAGTAGRSPTASREEPRAAAPARRRARPPARRRAR